jgi:hypothetical protein
VSGSFEARLRRLEEAAAGGEHLADDELMTDEELAARVRALFVAEPDSELARRVRAILERAGNESGRAS